MTSPREQILTNALHPASSSDINSTLRIQTLIPCLCLSSGTRSAHLSHYSSGFGLGNHMLITDSNTVQHHNIVQGYNGFAHKFTRNAQELQDILDVCDFFLGFFGRDMIRTSLRLLTTILFCHLCVWRGVRRCRWQRDRVHRILKNLPNSQQTSERKTRWKLRSSFASQLVQ